MKEEERINYISEKIAEMELQLCEIKNVLDIKNEVEQWKIWKIRHK